MRWRNPADEHAHDLYFHAEAAAAVVVKAVRERRASLSPQDAAHQALEPELHRAFEAGRRLGSAEQKDRLQATIRDHVEKALASIPRFGGASCPDCAGRGCLECGSTGSFRGRG